MEAESSRLILAKFALRMNARLFGIVGQFAGSPLDRASAVKANFRSIIHLSLAASRRNVLRPWAAPSVTARKNCAV
jgi:hypothetical protein